MDEKIIERYFNRNKNKVYALRNFLLLKNKDFKLKDALMGILEQCNGDFDETNKVIDYLTAKRKVYGKSQVYGSEVIPSYDLVRGKDGKIVVAGYNSSLPDIEKKEKQNPNPLKYKNSGEIRANYEKTSEKVYDIGQKLKYLYPNLSSNEIYEMIKTVREYAAAKKKSVYMIMDKIENKKLRFSKRKNGEFAILTNMRENKVIIVKDLSVIKESYEPLTFYAFQFSIKKFLSDLLNDPVNANVPDELLENGLTKKKALSYMINHEIIEKDSSIDDKDENGMPKTPVMNIKYKIPKKDFGRKLKKMFIYFFEKNLPSTISEDGMGGATSANISADAAYVQPVFQIQRRKIAQ